MKVKHKYLGTKKRSQISEKDLATKIKGRVQPASGALRSFSLKGDVQSIEYHCDDKASSAKSFSISIKLWKKLSNEAWKNDKRPILRINFEDTDPLYIMDEITFLELTRRKK